MQHVAALASAIGLASALPNHSYSRRFYAEGHRETAPDLAVYLYWDASCARGLSLDILRRKGIRGAVQGTLRQDAGQDIGPQDTAHLLDEDYL